jgi:hypothetical protein
VRATEPSSWDERRKAVLKEDTGTSPARETALPAVLTMARGERVGESVSFEGEAEGEEGAEEDGCGEALADG